MSVPNLLTPSSVDFVDVVSVILPQQPIGEKLPFHLYAIKSQTIGKFCHGCNVIYT